MIKQWRNNNYEIIVLYIRWSINGYMGEGTGLDKQNFSA